MRARVTAWLDDLRSPEFAVREAARAGLEANAAAAPDLLEARREDPDPEVRRTVRVLLERLKDPRAPEPPLVHDLQGLGRVDLAARGTLRDVCRQLGATWGARLEVPDEMADVTVEVSWQGTPFFQALDELLASAGLAAPDAFDADGRMAIGPADASAAVPTAYAGPMRLRVVEVTAIRELGTAAGNRRYALGLDLDWIPAVQLRTWRNPEALEARDPAGKTFVAGRAMRANTVYGVSTSSQRARVTIHLEPEDESAAERLDTLLFELPLQVRHEMQEVEFADVLSLDLPATRTAGDDGQDRVELQALTQPDGTRGPWVIDLVAHLVGETARGSLQTWLEREDGTLQSAGAGSRFPSADGTVTLSARAYGSQDSPPAAVRVRWYRRDEDGSLPFVLRDVPLR